MLIVLVMGYELLLDIIMLKEYGTGAGILAQYRIYLLQYGYCAVGDIPKVADG